MIEPTKYTNIDLCTIGLSVEIIKILKNESVQKYNDLLSKVLYNKGDGAKENFLIALSFLYLLGKIKYHKEEDVVEFLN